MKKEIPICSDCGGELRQEHLVDEDDRGYTSGFCFRCAKHFRLCSKNRYMTNCIKKVGHEGDHIDECGIIWNDSFYEQYYRK